MPPTTKKPAAKPAAKPKPAPPQVPVPNGPDPTLVLRWVGDLCGLLGQQLSNDDQRDLVAIGVRMSQHDRDRLLAILVSNAG